MKIEAVKLRDIEVSAGRLRKVKADYAGLFASMLMAGRELPPIKVRRTPNGARKLALVAGAHRLEAHRLAGRKQVEAQVVAASVETAREEEIEENLFRNELTALERIDAVAEYRRLFEARHGKIVAGNPDFANSAKLAELNLFGVAEDSEQGSFFARAAARLGVSRRAAERCATIAARLAPTLHDALTGSTFEDNGAAIERLSALPPAEQVNLAKLIVRNRGDAARAEEILLGHPAAPDTQKQRDAIVNRLGKMASRDRRSALIEVVKLYRADVEWALAKGDRT